MNKKIISFPYAVLLLIVFLFFIPPANSQTGQSAVSGGQGAEATPPSGSEEASPTKIPEMAEIVPLAGRLSGRLAILEKDALNLLDTTVVEKSYSEIEQKLESQSGRFEELKTSEGFGYYDLIEFSNKIKKEFESFDAIGKPVVRAINRLSTWRKEWLEERKRWAAWQSSLLKDERIGTLEATFQKASGTIDRALGIIHPQLESMLALQGKAADIRIGLDTLNDELNRLIDKTRGSAFLNESPPMFSSEYFSQLKTGLRNALRKGVDAFALPTGQFFFRVGWIVLIHVFVTLFVITVLIKKRRSLAESERLSFLTKKPFSAGLFVGYLTTVFIYAYVGSEFLWRFTMSTIVAISFVRLIVGLIETTWKKRFIYWLMVLFIANNLLNGLGIALPLFRLYIFLTALGSLFLFLRWAWESDEGLCKWALRAGSAFFAFILITAFWGRTRLLMHMFVSLVISIATIFVFMLLLYILHGFLEWLFRSSVIADKLRFNQGDVDSSIRRTVQLLYILTWGFGLLPAILMVFGAYHNLKDAIQGLLSFGFNVGENKISVGLLLVAAGVLYGSVFVSWILRRVLMDDMLHRSSVERGVRHAMARLLHYFIVFIAFLLAISILGFDITKLTIMLSALGVGIGFGLQSIVNNFVCGLILLFERPIRVGDSIELTGQWAEIKRIGLRATTVQTFDQADVIVPNADLVTNQVTNWTLSSRQVRLLVPVGVAYGSDVSLVMEKLIACANSNEMVAKMPPPQVLFLSFGESSLDFELRVWVEAENRLQARSDLHQEIDKSFREANIEIAFPQRDLHIRSVDKSISLDAVPKPPQ